MNVHKASKYLTVNDEAMSRLIARTGVITLPPPRGDFESLVDAIISQQLR